MLGHDQLVAEKPFVFAHPPVSVFEPGMIGPGQIFYDSQCSVPVFQLKRPVSEFIRDSQEMGWLSFRMDERLNETVSEDAGEIVSSCGTHLGNLIPGTNK